MCQYLNKIAYSFYAKEIYINFLTYVSEISKDENDKYLHDYNLVLKEKIESRYGYNDEEADSAKNYLVNSGYLMEIGKPKNLFITEEGQKFLQDYYRFRMLGRLGKFTAIFNKNFFAISSVLSLVVSMFALLVSFVNSPSIIITGAGLRITS